MGTSLLCILEKYCLKHSIVRKSLTVVTVTLVISSSYIIWSSNPPCGCTGSCISSVERMTVSPCDVISSASSCPATLFSRWRGHWRPLASFSRNCAPAVGEAQQLPGDGCTDHNECDPWVLLLAVSALLSL